VKRIAFASHVTSINGKEYDGIGNVVIETLSSLTDEFIFVRHSMDGLLPSEVQTHHKAKNISKVQLHVLSRVAPLRYLTEILKTVYYFTFKAKVDVYVGIDPLNALAGILLKKLKRVDTVVFYTADYSLHRFKNTIMNTIYHRIDAYCVKHASEVWSVSSKIVAIRKEMGLSDNRNIFVPNVPPIEFDGLRRNKHDVHTLIMYGIVDTQLDFEGAIRAVAHLASTIPGIRLTIVGNGPEEARLKKLARELKVSEHIIFMGRQTLAKTLDAASRSGIGLALYTGVWSFNEYGDSTKCREYFNYGLPVISTDSHSTVDEIKQYEAGIIVEKSVDAYVSAITSILAQYDDFSRHSLKLGEKYQGIHQKVFRRILS